MKYLTKKDKKTRINFYSKEILLNVLKHLKKNTFIQNSIRWKAASFLFCFNPKKFKTKIINRCIISGRQRGIMSKFKLSRIFFAKYAYSGKIFSLKN